MPEAAAGPRERRDVDPRVIALFAGGLVGFLILALAALRLIFGVPPSPPAFGSGTGLDPSRVPVLQTDPRADRAAYDAEKSTELNGLGWVDRTAGIAHLPIADAMRMVAEHGLPNFTAASATATANAGSSSSPASGTDCALLQQNVPRAPQAAACPPSAAPTPPALPPTAVPGGGT